MPFYSFLSYIALSILLSTGCTSFHKEYLRAQIYPYGRKNLASYHLDTPDPLKMSIESTELLLIEWNLSSKSLKRETPSPLSLIVTLRFKNGSEKELQIPVENRKGKTTITLESEEYKNSGEMSSYKIELFNGAEKTLALYHKMWSEKILIEE